MQFNEWVFALHNGLATGMATFLVAAGLTWIFGILKILNMAHGHFYMVGAYVAFSIMGRHPDSLGQWLGAAAVAGVAVGVLGGITDRVLLARLRSVDYHYVLIAIFALLLCVEGAVRLIWGGEVQSIEPPPVLAGPVQLGTLFIPKFTLVVIVAGAIMFVALELVLPRTWAGKLMQAVARDPWMAGLMGVNVPALLSASAVLSFAVAGFAGGLLIPMQSLDLTLGGARCCGPFSRSSSAAWAACAVPSWRRSCWGWCRTWAVCSCPTSRAFRSISR